MINGPFSLLLAGWHTFAKAQRRGLVGVVGGTGITVGGVGQEGGVAVKPPFRVQVS